MMFPGVSLSKNLLNACVYTAHFSGSGLKRSCTSSLKITRTVTKYAKSRKYIVALLLYCSITMHPIIIGRHLRENGKLRTLVLIDNDLHSFFIFYRCLLFAITIDSTINTRMVVTILYLSLVS